MGFMTQYTIELESSYPYTSTTGIAGICNTGSLNLSSKAGNWIKLNGTGVYSSGNSFGWVICVP